MNQVSNLIAIYLSPEESASFLLFQKHYVAFKMLESVGAFNIRTGSVRIDFDKEGQIKGIDVNQMYRP